MPSDTGTIYYSFLNILIMTHISKIIPALAVTAGMALAMVTSGFTKADPNPKWVLKTGAQVGSTDPADYEQGAPTCPGDIHFCAFSAPESAIPGEPDIDAVTGLNDDLENLADNANGHYNSSGVVEYKDAAQ